MLPTYVIYVTLVTSFVGIFSYIRSIVNGSTRPNLASWLMWFLAPMIASVVGFVSGAGVAILPVFLAGFGPFLVLVFALFNKNSYWQLNDVDRICLAFSIIAIIFWFVFKESTLATLFAILADGFAYIPTYIKSWKNPKTENKWPYLIGIFNNLLGLFFLNKLNFVTAGFSIYLIIANFIEVVIVKWSNKKL